VTHRNWSRFLILFLFLLAFATVAWAQEATIVGTITDPSGAAVPGVQIAITNTETGVVHRIVSNDVGQYVVPDLVNGHYSIKVEASGFKAAERTDIVLDVGDRIRVDFKLEIGATTESVKVEANPIAVQADTGEESNVVTGQQVTQLATNGRTIYSLALLVPGVANDIDSFQAPTAQGSSTAIAFNGLRADHNLFMADGAEEDDRGGASRSIIAPSLDALSEFRVLESNYSAEFGLTSAATVTMVFKSGTKDFHASAWEFVRNNDFDANNFFLNKAGVPNPELRLNTYGFNVGGPVTLGHIYNKNRDKTFFFYNMEWRKLIQPGSTLDTTVPATSEYGGVLTSAANTPYACQVSSQVAAQFLAQGLQLSGCTNGQPDATKKVLFPNNTIPTALLDPNVQLMLKQGIFPGPNSGAQFIGATPVPTDVREEIVRIDHQFSDKFWIFGHWLAEPTTQNYNPPMWSGDNVNTVGNTFSNPSYTGVIHATNSISPTLLLETAFNYDGNRIAIIPNGKITQPSGFSAAGVFTGNNPSDKNPGISLGQLGTSYDPTQFPWTNSANDYQIREDVSWTRGAHQMKIGAGWAIYSKKQSFFGETEGSYNFNGKYTGDDFADMLLGLANSYSQLAYQGSGTWDAQSPFAYFQDNWRVNNRLTLNLGLRWDGIPHTYEINHQSSDFYPSDYNFANAAILGCNGNCISPSSPGLTTSTNPVLKGAQFYTNGVGVGGLNGFPNGLVNNHWANFGPRLGLAYDLTGKGKTVLRGGFGTMFERIQGNDMYNGATNVPNDISISNSGVFFSNPNESILTGATVALPISVAGLTTISPTNYKNPTTYSYSLGVQQQIGHATVVTASYVGNHSSHEFDYRDINLPDPSELPAIIAGTVNINTVVPYLGFGDIKQGENAENAHYNSLQLSARSQLSKDLFIMGSYTYSRSVDPVSEFGSDDNNIVMDPYNINQYIGPSQMDITNIGVLSFVYDLPVFRSTGNAFEKSVLGGWELSGIWSIQSGLPVFVTLGGAAGSNGLWDATNVPNFNGTISYPKTASQWFTTSGFSAPAVGQWGNLPYGSIREPGRDNWNIALFKSFLLSETRGSHFELRFESFNTFNHTQFSGVGNSFSNLSQFGVPNGAWDPRELQFGGKIIF
jgi:hypothetical protein